MKEHYWYLRSVEEVYDELETNQHGLTNNEASKRLEEHGPNQLEEAERFKPFKVLLQKANSLLVYILLATGTISLLSGHALEFWVILAILAFTVLFSWFQEYQAAHSVQALKNFSATKVVVIRQDQEREINAKELVPGDTILLTRGMIIPADVRVTASSGLRVDESILTGESVQKPKHAKRIDEQDIPISDQSNLAFSGTSVTTGSGKGVVIATGSDSAVGKISHSLKEIGYQQTPLQVRVEEMSQRISLIVLAVAVLFFALLIYQQTPLFAALVLVGALAVSGIPESFPLVLTVALTHGVRQMAAENAIVKDLSSVETLGTATVICTDKTGTLTQNRMRATQIVFPDQQPIQVVGSGYEPKASFTQDDQQLTQEQLQTHKRFFETCVYCNDAELNFEENAWELQGEPTEGALLALAKSAGYNEEVMREDHPREDEIPFDPDEKFMVAAHKNTAYLKGASEVVLKKCSYVRVGTKKKKLTKKRREELLAQVQELSNSQLRVLALASKKYTKRSSLNTGFVYEGVAGIEDPVRPEAIAAVEQCATAGIDVVMITGDHVSTARSIAEQLGILTDNRSKVLEGADLDVLEDEDLDAVIQQVAVFARTTPDHKLRIVKSLQRHGELVAMTGDGVNDAPALKKADLGVSMGRGGTEVAREASNLVLADDNFATIVEAVRRGRTIYSNIRRFIFYLLTGNFTEVSLLFLTVLLGMQAPLTALLVLFINLVTSSLPAFALAVEPTKEKVMRYQPRDPKQRLLGDYLLTKILVLIPLLFIGCIGVFWYLLELRGVSIEYARTAVFATIVCFELFHVFNARSLHASIFTSGLFSNKYVFAAVAASAGLMVAVIHVPALQVLFSTQALLAEDWLRIVAVSSSIIVLSEIVKLMIRSEIKEQSALQGVSLRSE